MGKKIVPSYLRNLVMYILNFQIFKGVLHLGLGHPNGAKKILLKKRSLQREGWIKLNGH